MIQQLNYAYESMPEIEKRKAGDVTNAYQKILRQSSMWKTKDVPTVFPISRFTKHSTVKFPSDVLQVSEDRRKWTCLLCNYDRETSVRKKFHRQNCLNHFRSMDHCALAAALQSKGAAVTEAVEQMQQHIFAADLPRAVIDDAIVSACRKSLSLEAIRIVLDVAQRALNSVQPAKHLTDQEIMLVRKVSPDAADIVIRVNALTKPANTSAGTRGPCRRGRTAITKRLLELGKRTLSKKVEHLLACKFLGITADESDTYSFSAPLAVALQGCTPTFEWANMFIGQTDVATKRDGPGLWEKLVELLNQTHPELLVLIIFSTFDGASAMRSTPKYAGLDSNPTGSCLVAEMKRNHHDGIGNLHCIPHNLNLALKKAMKECDAWMKQWLDHVKCIFHYFCKSPTRKADLKQLHKAMELLNDVVTWRFMLPKYHCPTRWVGYVRALDSVLPGMLLEAYVDKLVEEGWLPDRRTAAETPQVLPPDAEHARLEESDEEGDEDDNDVDERAHAASFHKWGTSYCDLPITSTNDDFNISSEAARLELDSEGRAAVWKDLPSGTSSKNRCGLLSERIGVTAQMLGIDSILLDALIPYKILIERLQTQIVPIGHKVRL